MRRSRNKDTARIANRTNYARSESPFLQNSRLRNAHSPHFQACGRFADKAVAEFLRRLLLHRICRTPYSFSILSRYADMCSGRQRKHFFQRVSKRFFRLGRYRKHQVKADISHTALPQCVKRLFAYRHSPAVRAEQVRRRKRLNAHADASDAVSDKRTDKFLCHIFRDSFQRLFPRRLRLRNANIPRPRMRQSCSDVKTDGVPPPIYTERTEPPKSALLFDSQAHKHNLRAFFERICE